MHAIVFGSLAACAAGGQRTRLSIRVLRTICNQQLVAAATTGASLYVSEYYYALHNSYAISYIITLYIQLKYGTACLVSRMFKHSP
jgi:hypothetical protein